MYGILSDKVKGSHGLRFYGSMSLVLFLSSLLFTIIFVVLLDKSNELIWDRILIMLFAMTCFLLSYKVHQRNKWYFRMVNVMFMLATIQQIFAATINNFELEYFISYIITLLAVGMSLRRKEEAVIYLAISSSIIITGVVFSEHLPLSDRTFLGLIIVFSSLFVYVLSKIKCEFQDRTGMYITMLKSLTSHTDRAVLITDMQGNIYDLNPRIFELTGYTRKNLVDTNLFDSLLEDVVDEPLDDLVSKLKQEGIVSINTEIRRKDGSMLFAEVNMAYLNKLDKEFLIHRITDRTLNRENEQKLLLAKEEAELATKIKTQFLAQMSHEIRTPLNGLIGMTSLLESTNIDSQQKEMIDTIKKSGKDLMVVINDILDFSKIESGKMKLEIARADLKESILEVSHLLQQNAESKGLELKIELDNSIPPHIWTDITRVKQVLLNLLGNAIKFTDRGFVKIGCKVQSIAHHQVDFYISVTDTGQGFSEDKKQLLFQSFSQVHPENKSNHIKGTGLGLAISKQLVELLGGTIDCKSVEGKGSEFFFVLPTRVAETSGEQQIHNNRVALNEILQYDLGSLKFLVAEDNIINQQVLLQMLRNFGVHADLASDGFEAIELYNKKGHDIILMDIQMPGLNGYEATKEILRCAGENGKKVQVVAITANATSTDEKLCRDHGMSDYLPKPFLPEQVAEMIINSLERMKTVKKEVSSTGHGLKRA